LKNIPGSKRAIKKVLRFDRRAAVFSDLTNSQHQKKPPNLSGFPNRVCIYNVWLFDNFDYAASAGVNEHRSIVDYGVAILANTVFLRNVVVSDARFRKLCTHPYITLIAVGRAALFNHITSEARALIHAQYSGYTADDPSNRAANDSAHRTCRAFAFAGTPLNASRHTLG
jgi:hypothetical protein